MYTSFRVKNFRGFEDLELNDLARINLIAGKNNVGKTALLEALFIYSNPYNPELTLNVSAFRGMTRLKVEFGKWQTRTPWDTLFPDFNTQQRIELSGTHSQLANWQLGITLVQDLKEFAALGPITTPTEANGDNNSGAIVLSSFQSEIARIIRLELEREGQEPSNHYMAIDSQANKHFMPNPILPDYQSVFLPARDRFAKDDAERFSNLKRQRKMDLLLNALQIIEPRLKGLDYLSDGLYGDVEDVEQLIPLAAMGDGITRLTSLITAIGFSPNGMVLLDEIENGFHYSVLTDVWKAIAVAAREFNVQIFATTHSIEMIRAAHEAFKDQEPYDFRLHRLDRSYKTGEIYATTYDETGMAAAVELNAEVR